MTQTSAENKIIKAKPPTPKTFEHDAIKIGVVPEHFSTPFHLGLERDIFNERDLHVDVIEYPRGTGSMCTALREGQLDVAVALTEGLVSDIIKNGNDVFKICGTYVNSPLKWGIVVNPNSSRGVGTLKDLHDKTIGISRYGSGSHIMSFLLAEQEQWYKQEGTVHSDDHDLSIQFKVCGGLDDLRTGVRTESVDTFLWETFMLKHFVDEGELKQVGDILTPWPCFMIAVRNDVIKKQRDQIERLFDTISYCSKLFYQERQESLNFISSSCHLQMADAEKWYQTVQFAENTRKVSEKVLKETKQILQRAKVLSKDVDIQTVYNTDFVQL